MARITGSMTLPQELGSSSAYTSKLKNDSRFTAIYEFILDSTLMQGSASLQINNQIPANSLIYQVDVITLVPFVSDSSEEPEISIVVNGNTIMADYSSDLSEIGTYSSMCYQMISDSDSIIVNHTPDTFTEGKLILRFYAYQLITRE